LDCGGRRNMFWTINAMTYKNLQEGFSQRQSQKQRERLMCPCRARSLGPFIDINFPPRLGRKFDRVRLDTRCIRHNWVQKKCQKESKRPNKRNTYEQKLLPMNIPLDALRVSVWSGICWG